MPGKGIYSPCKTSEFRLPNKRWHVSRSFVDCNTYGIVYIYLCECGSFYLVKMIRPFIKRIEEHVYAISFEDLSTTFGYHAAKFHKYADFKFKFAALDRVVG